ncbi:methyl-viologen-reducing hydrogenase subunitdelta [groundwater metagenome]
MKNGVFLCTCSGTIDIDFKKLKSSAGADVIEVHEMLCQEPEKIKDVFERKELSRALVACTSKKEVFEALDLDISFVNLREHCGWVHDREDATEKAAALVGAALNCPRDGRKTIIDAGKDVLIIGPASPSIKIAQHMSRCANIRILITEPCDFGAGIPTGINILSGRVKDIEGGPGDFRIKTLKNPVSSEECISCGKCIDVCPINAIDRYPVFSVSENCDRCGKCYDVCPTQAIDLEDNIATLKTGQVLAIGKNAIYPEEKKGFYITSIGKDVEGTVSLALPAAMEIIANTGGIERDAPVKAILEGCAAGKSGFLGCTLCERACRHGAIIRKEDNITFDEISCTGCGACASVCPLSLFRMEDDIYGKMEYLLCASKPAIFKRTKRTHKILMFTCAHSIPLLDTAGAQKIKYPAVLPLFVPDLARVSETHILRAFDLGAEGVIMLGCDECTGDVSEEACGLAGLILDEFKLGDRIKVIRNNNDVKSFAESVKFFNEHIATIQPGRHTPVKLTNASNRRILLEIIASLAAKTGITPGSVVPVFKYGVLGTTAPFADISIGASCTVCGACTSMCPAGALIRDGGSIASIYSYCIACGLCEQACPEKALKMRRVLDMAKMLNTVPSILFKSELQVCASCNKPYMTQAAFDRIAGSFIENVRGDLEPRDQVELIKHQVELLRYCENCRPVRAVLKMEVLA